jgi:hypothetical protein
MTVDEYERIVAAGALLEPGRVELIDGYLVEKMGKNPKRRYTTEEVRDAFRDRLPPGWTPRQEQPVQIPAYDEAEPDVAIVRGSNADYRHRIPAAADVALLVEVSDSSLPLDRGPKLSAYEGEDPRLLDRQPGRPPGRGLHRPETGPLPVARRLQDGPAGAGGDRRPVVRPDRRRRHPAVTSVPLHRAPIARRSMRLKAIGMNKWIDPDAVVQAFYWTDERGPHLKVNLENGAEPEYTDPGEIERLAKLLKIWNSIRDQASNHP